MSSKNDPAPTDAEFTLDDNNDFNNKPPVEWPKIKVNKNNPDGTSTEKEIELKGKSPPNKKKEEMPAKENQEENLTIIPLSRTREEFEKADIPWRYIKKEDDREVFEKQSGGKWTREVTKIKWIKLDDDSEWLDWDEKRHAKTKMGRELHKTISHVPTYDIPIANQEVQYDEENEENKLVNTGQVTEMRTAYQVPFSATQLDYLLKDATKKCEYIVKLGDTKGVKVTKGEMKKYAGDFNKLHKRKSPILEAQEEKEE
jgi:hypothetical protein